MHTTAKPTRPATNPWCSAVLPSVAETCELEISSRRIGRAPDCNSRIAANRAAVSRRCILHGNDAGNVDGPELSIAKGLDRGVSQYRHVPCDCDLGNPHRDSRCILPLSVATVLCAAKPGPADHRRGGLVVRRHERLGRPLRPMRGGPIALHGGVVFLPGAARSQSSGGDCDELPGVRSRSTIRVQLSVKLPGGGFPRSLCDASDRSDFRTSRTRAG